jgi:hypothetical protein
MKNWFLQKNIPSLTLLFLFATLLASAAQKLVLESN